MPLSLTIKRKIDTCWQDCPAAELAGQTIGQICWIMAGKQAVAEVIDNGNTYYLCGTAELKAGQEKKQRTAFTFSQWSDLMRLFKPEVLEQQIPHLAAVVSIFPGSTFGGYHDHH